jgi:hypothetical protein
MEETETDPHPNNECGWVLPEQAVEASYTLSEGKEEKGIFQAQVSYSLNDK